MPLDASDLIQPEGRLEEDLFPDLENRVVVYLADAVTRTADISDEDDRERAQEAWVYYRAYQAKADQMTAQPMDVTVDGNTSRRYDYKQIALFRALAQEELEVFNGYVEEDEPTSNTLQTFVLQGGRYF